MQKELDEPGCGEEKRGGGERWREGRQVDLVTSLKCSRLLKSAAPIPVASGEKKSTASVTGFANDGCGMSSSKSPAMAARRARCARQSCRERYPLRAFCATAATIGTRASARVRPLGLMPWPVSRSAKSGPERSRTPPSRVRELMWRGYEVLVARCNRSATSAAAAQPVDAERSVVLEVGKAPASIPRMAPRRQSRTKGHQALQRG